MNKQVVKKLYEIVLLIIVAVIFFFGIHKNIVALEWVFGILFIFQFIRTSKVHNNSNPFWMKHANNFHSKFHNKKDNNIKDVN